MGAGALYGFIEADAGQRVVAFCGPSGAMRLAMSSSALLPSLCFENLRVAAAKLVWTGPRREPSSSGLLDVEAMREAVTTAAPQLLPADGTWLRYFCWMSSGHSVEGVDRLVSEAARPESADLAAAASVWAAAFGKQALADFLERLSASCETSRMSAALRPALRLRREGRERHADEDEFFSHIFDGHVAGVILDLAGGADVEATGPAIHQGDVGCCRWTPLAAAAEISGRRKQGAVIAGLLLAARARVDRKCPGPCGWTPLMRAASCGASAAATLQLLMRAGADVRIRHENGSTALEMGDKAAARILREARDSRMLAAPASAGPKGTGRPTAESQGSFSRGRAGPRNALALAHAGRAGHGAKAKSAGRGYFQKAQT
ncbi:unnamed protein product [Symbiodinium natans]|uniref:Uncharacterized protein n=1 Tax=Symbiodinium natans TaxID=878477 RepID=A0A812J8I5_9DINO|nr:unnamed protein product [Symbiodinium natans]